MTSITLLSDFGLHDASAGAAKGVLLSAIPGARITDISHEISPYHISQAAYLLGSAYSNFPSGTVHLVIVDVFSAPLPRLVLSRHDGHYFLAPDNGIIPLALHTNPENAWLAFELTKEQKMGDWLRAAANTIKLLQSQRLENAGMQACTLTPLPANTLQQQAGAVACSVLYIDHFGNVVTDMVAGSFSSLNKTGRFRLNFMRVNEITAVSTHYNDVAHGEHLCRFNHNGYLEICVNQGSASSLFGFRLGGKHNDVKITFE